VASLLRFKEESMPRTRSLCCAAAIALCVAGTAHASSQSEREADLVKVVNETRTAHGLRPLRVDDRLTVAARDHSQAMLRENAFGHGAFRARLAAYGARGPVFGENLAWSVGSPSTAHVVVRMWLASAPHRANLLRPGFRRVGIGAPVGTFAGHRGATVVTADFAGS
jgi:uncharacterized protein YkwD